MTEKFEIYKCHICGNTIQVLLEGNGDLVCCGENMEHLIPQYKKDELGEKHVPEIIEENQQKFIRLTKHPMISEHYIQLIEAYSDDKTEMRLKFLYPDQKAEFEITGFNCNKAIELCNIHGLWRNNNEN